MDNIFEIMLLEQQKNEIIRTLACNEKAQKFGLILSEEDAKYLIETQRSALKDNQRMTFGQGIIPELIMAFCDSQYINQSNYVETLSSLQEIFYLFKNESQDELNDYELITFMRNQYETTCFGDLDYLSGTCLERFTRAVRSGYQSEMQYRLRDEYTLKKDGNEYDQFSEEIRWDYEVYKLRLEDMY